MSTGLGKSCSLGSLYVSFVNVYQYMCVTSFLFAFGGEVWDLIVLFPIIAFLFTL